MSLVFKTSLCYAAGRNWPLLAMLVFILSNALVFFDVQKVSAKTVNPVPRIFGKMEIRSPVKSVPQWVRVMRLNEAKVFFKDDRKIQNTTWGALKKKWIGLPIKEKLRAVNLFWNKWPYRLDIDVYKTIDYWAIPQEFYSNSGDCEDYAIIKYYTLIELGVPREDMRIAIVKETIRNIAHAVLVVYTDGDAYVLDNLSNQILSHKVYTHYDLRYSINEFNKWSHFKPKAKK